jgi:hypothetical protein
MLNSLKLNDSMNKWTNELNRAFSKEEVQAAKKHIKKYSTFLITKEMQIKTTLRFHLTLVRMATTGNTHNNKLWQGCRGKGTLIHWWWEWKLVQPLQKTVWRLLKNLKMDLPNDPEIPLLGYTQRNVSQLTTKTPEQSCLLQDYSQ